MSIDNIANEIDNAFAVNPIKDKIVNGIKVATEQMNYTLVAEEWGSKDAKCACALGCMLVANNLHLETATVEDNEVLAADILGVDTMWIEDFITGFDDGHAIRPIAYQDAYDLGAELRTKFLI